MSTSSQENTISAGQIAEGLLLVQDSFSAQEMHALFYGIKGRLLVGASEEQQAVLGLIEEDMTQGILDSFDMTPVASILFQGSVLEARGVLDSKIATLFLQHLGIMSVLSQNDKSSSLPRQKEGEEGVRKSELSVSGEVGKLAEVYGLPTQFVEWLQSSDRVIEYCTRKKRQGLYIARKDVESLFVKSSDFGNRLNKLSKERKVETFYAKDLGLTQKGHNAIASFLSLEHACVLFMDTFEHKKRDTYLRKEFYQ